jgi:putative membrane protein
MDFLVRLVSDLVSAAVFGLLSIFLVVVGFKLFDWATPKLAIQEALMEKNIAVAITISSVIVGICIVVGCVVIGIFG